MKILEKNMKAVENNYTSIHKKLKPMFGHPEKSRMLDVVETYMNQAEEFNEKTLLNNMGHCEVIQT